MRLLVLVAFAASLAGVFTFQQHRRAAEQARLSSIASEIAGRDVSVRCQGAVGQIVDITSESGSVQFYAGGRPADVADVKRPICVRLAAFAEDRSSDRFACLAAPQTCSASVVKDAIALNVLAHEAWHLHGEQNEAVTECYATQTVGFVATKLGADNVQARGLAQLFYLTVYPRMPDEYRSAECRDGGALDIRPQSPAWPS